MENEPDGPIFGDQHAGGLVEVEASVLLGNVREEQPQSGAPAHLRDHQREVPPFHPVEVREDLLPHELLGGPRDLPPVRRKSPG